nr:aldo/keto reductase [Halovivax sp.]
MSPPDESCRDRCCPTNRVSIYRRTTGPRAVSADGRGRGRTTEEGDLELTEERANELLDADAEAGGRYVDTADVYGGGDGERWIGDWLADRDRERYAVASKLYWQIRDDRADRSSRRPPRGARRQPCRSMSPSSVARSWTPTIRSTGSPSA